MTDQITARAPISLINEATDNRGQTFTATIEFVTTWFAEPNQKFPAITLKEKTGKITEKWVWLLEDLKQNGSESDFIHLNIEQNWLVTGMQAIIKEADSVLSSTLGKLEIKKKASSECTNCKQSISNETYVVHDKILQKAKHIGKLCIGCLENKLGRMLNKEDFKQTPLNFAKWFDKFKSARLKDRLHKTAQFEEDDTEDYLIELQQQVQEDEEVRENERVQMETERVQREREEEEGA